MKKLSIRLFILTLIAAGIMVGFSGFSQPQEETQPEAKTLTLTFTVNELEGYSRSDQLVVWLEKPDGSFVKSLFVSEWLSWVGYQDPEVCGDWSSKTNWLEASQEEFDAVTHATPQIGERSLELILPADIVPDGKYVIFVEVHSRSDYNELHSRKIKISGKEFSKELKVTYIPERYPEAKNDIITDVYISFNN